MWISTSETLPPLNTAVLVLFKKSLIIDVYELLRLENGDLLWSEITDCGEDNYCYPFNDISFWQYLPQITCNECRIK